MENNIRQIRQVFKNVKQAESREMSRKSSRAHSRRGSMDILEEEMSVTPMNMNISTEFPEEEEEEFPIRSRSRSRNELDCVESDSDMDISPANSRRASSRRPSIVTLPTGRWSRRSSLAGNEFLKMDDEVLIENL